MSLFHTVKESPVRIGVHCNGGMELRWATLELVAFFFDEEGRDHYQWIVRRFDWFDPSPHRDPSFNQAVSPNELRELLEILDHLNATIDEHDWATILQETSSKEAPL